MKTIFKISTVIILLTILLLSCNKDNADPTPDPDPINQAPNNFNLKGVTNGASGVDLLPKFTWDAATDPDGDTVTYNLYMDGNENPTTLVAENLTATNYQITDKLPLVTQFYWKVVAKDTKGKTTTSNDSYNFTTRSLNISTAPVTNNAAFSKREGHASVAFKNKLWVIGGYDGSLKNDIWSSIDGENWTEETPHANFSARGGIAGKLIVFNNKLWLIGGNRKNDIWSSSDGVNWIQVIANAAFSKRLYHSTIVFNNKIWVIAGYDGRYKNDVWSSSDGVNWVQKTTNAPFSGRTGHSTIVFNNKLWIIGGYDGNNLNDVWSSNDGVNWTQVTNNAQFSERNTLQNITIFNNKIWLIGGAKDGGFDRKNDIWYSTDGENWIQLTNNANFSPRSGHTSVVFDNKLWVIGGLDEGLKNDVWAFD